MPELLLPTPGQATALYRAHGAAVRALIRALLRGDPSAVEDLCQETFAAALARGVPAEGAGPWLFAVARNQVRKHLRDRKPVAASPQEPLARDATPATRLLGDERRAAVRRAVDALPDELACVVRLRYEGGLSYTEVAARLELPHATVQGRLKRARVALRAALVAAGEGEEVTA